MRDRRRYLHWVFEAKKRFGLSVRDYTVTSNRYALRERREAYAGEFTGENDALRSENAIAWEENAETVET
jgi:hypothetical protein